MRALPESARAYHAFGTTSVFEGHGIATEVLRAYKEAHRDGTLTMRTTLAFSPNWQAAGERAAWRRSSRPGPAGSASRGSATTGSR